MFSVKDIKAVIFDVDGTLMDTVGRIVSCMEAAFKENSVELPSKQAIKNIIGISLVEACATLNRSLSEEKVAAIAESYRQIYIASEKKEQAKLFKDAIPVLEKLKDNGYRLALATGKSRSGCNRIMKCCGLDKYMDASVAGDEVPSKPAPDMLIKAASLLGCHLNQCLMVGDSTLDLAMADKAGMPSAGVLTGVHDEITLNTCHPLGTFGSLTDLWNFLENSKLQ